MLTRQLRSTEVSDETRKEILKGCKDLVPELLDSNGEFEVLSSQVGLRPGREGGPRVELEILRNKEVVIHSYGHAGAG